MKDLQQNKVVNLHSYQNSQSSSELMPPLELPECDYDGVTINMGNGNSIELHRDILGRIVGITISKELLAIHPEFELCDLEGLPMFALLMLHWEDVAHATGVCSDVFDELFLMPSEEMLLQAWQWWKSRLTNFH